MGEQGAYASARAVNVLRSRIGKAEATLRTLSQRVEAIEATQVSIKADTTEILNFIKGTKTVTGFARKHGPRLMAFGVGVMVAGGYLSAETGKSFLSIFGL